MTEYRNVLLVSPTEVKTETVVNYAVSDSAVAYAITMSQNIYLSDIIGYPLLDKIQLLVYNKIKGLDDNIDDEKNAAYKTLLDDYIVPYLTAKAQSEILFPISLKIRNIGVSQDSDTNINASSLEHIKYLRNTFETSACKYATRLSDYISNNNKAYSEIDCHWKGKHYVNTGLWLGNNKDIKY